MSDLVSPHPLQRRLIAWLWVLIAAVPVVYIGLQTVVYSRNIVFWDEFDTALDLILRIDEGAGWRELVERFFAVNNEHRMVTSRLMFAGSYWLTGTVNFHVIGAVGNLFLVGACAILVATVTGVERRLRLGVALAFLLFQLEHFENFLWSGASIDHFQVVMLAVGSIAALNRPTWPGLAGAAVLALLATFTLAHGTLAWLVGTLLLIHQHRFRHLAIWCVGAAATAAAFLHGFEFNPGHQIAEPMERAVQIARYWLALLGGPLTLGDAGFAPVPGLVLVAGFIVLIARGALAQQPVAMFSALFAIAALGMVAVGRVEIASASEINSRYQVLGALAWALCIFMLLELGANPQKPFRLLVCMTPALALFNLAANVKFAPIAEGFIEVRDRAATSFKQHGVDGRGLTRLHPLDGHADALLRLAAERGIYRLPRVSEFVSLPPPRPSPDMITHVDQLLATERAVTIGGWAMLPGRPSRRGQVHVVLKSEKTFLVATTVTLQRPDVAKAYQEPGWRLSGFRAVIGTGRLPAEDFEVGVLIDDEDEPEYVMTGHRLLLSGSTPAAVRKPEKS